MALFFLKKLKLFFHFSLLYVIIKTKKELKIVAYPRNYTDAYSGLSEQPEDAYIDFPQNYNSAPQYLSSSPDLDDLIELLELEDQRTSATTLRIPNSVVEINPELLKYCYDLVSITIGSQVKTVDASIFYDCINLKEVHFTSPDTVITGDIDKYLPNADFINDYNEDKDDISHDTPNLDNPHDTL